MRRPLRLHRAQIRVKPDEPLQKKSRAKPTDPNSAEGARVVSSSTGSNNPSAAVPHNTNTLQ
jgi:hypothetical protein